MNHEFFQINPTIRLVTSVKSTSLHNKEYYTKLPFVIQCEKTIIQILPVYVFQGLQNNWKELN